MDKARLDGRVQRAPMQEAANRADELRRARLVGGVSASGFAGEQEIAVFGAHDLVRERFGGALEFLHLPGGDAGHGGAVREQAVDTAEGREMRRHGDGRAENVGDGVDVLLLGDQPHMCGRSGFDRSIGKAQRSMQAHRQGNGHTREASTCKSMGQLG